MNIETKFEIGDTVYYIDGDMYVEYIVDGITIDLTSSANLNPVSVKYRLINKKNPIWPICKYENDMDCFISAEQELEMCIKRVVAKLNDEIKKYKERLEIHKKTWRDLIHHIKVI